MNTRKRHSYEQFTISLLQKLWFFVQTIKESTDFQGAYFFK